MGWCLTHPSNLIEEHWGRLANPEFDRAGGPKVFPLAQTLASQINKLAWNHLKACPKRPPSGVDRAQQKEAGAITGFLGAAKEEVVVGGNSISTSQELPWSRHMGRP